MEYGVESATMIYVEMNKCFPWRRILSKTVSIHLNFSHSFPMATVPMCRQRETDGCVH